MENVVIIINNIVVQSKHILYINLDEMTYSSDLFLGKKEITNLEIYQSGVRIVHKWREIKGK